MAYVASGYVATGYVEDIAPATGYPSPSDVKAGIVYGPALEYTGTYTGGTGPTAAEIAAAVLAAAMITPIHADMRKVRGQALAGAGSEADPWGPGA